MLISHLTTGEKLFVDRQRAGLSMSEAAKTWDVSLHTYRKWENDDPDVPIMPDIPPLGKLTGTEELRLFRRRSGLTVRQISGKLKCCPWWIRLMERGDASDAPLREFWGR